MNYAEDRLDRRARTSAACSVVEELGESKGRASTTVHELEHDLKQAHCVIRNHNELLRPLDIIRDESNQELITALKELLEAHRLAGRTLRDGGSNHQAVFHFGIAWKLCFLMNNLHQANGDEREMLGDISSCNKCVDESEEWETVGDYSQMAELAGFPEVGVLAILFYRNGSFAACQSDEKQLFHSDDYESHSYGCGCGMAMCGCSQCYIAFPNSTLINEILEAFDELPRTFIHGEEEKITMPSALDILNQLALLSGKSSGYTSKERLLKMYQYMNERVKDLKVKVPTILQFWDDQLSNQYNQTLQHTTRRLPSVLVLLLLKLLYSSPISVPFLQLACHSVPYLNAILPISSKEGRYLANKYKSHWAYFVFIRALVLGDRIKKKTGNNGALHLPIWDVLINRNLSNANKHTDIAFVTHISFTTYIQDLILQLQTPTKHSSVPPVLTFGLPHKPIFVLGDSHVLSLAWQSICINHSSDPKVYRVLVPFPSTGVKAWHFRKETKFFTHYNLCESFKRLFRCFDHDGLPRTVIVSAGEIDCREGIGGSLLHGYYKNCSDAVKNTALQYLDAVSLIARKYHLQILVMPVAPHAFRSEKNGKALGRAKRRETIHLWNEILRRELCKSPMSKRPNVFLLDYEEQLRVHDEKSSVGYVLKPSFNADYTHVNGAVVRLIEHSLQKCGCDIDLI